MRSSTSPFVRLGASFGPDPPRLDSLEALALLDGVIDIYMPDMKYGDDTAAHKYSHVRDYVRVNQAAVREMHRQVGDLAINAAGLAERGLLVRHLALPNGLAGTEAALRFLAEEISSDTYLNVMGQYRPCYRADEHPDLERPISGDEFSEALAIARRCGLHRLDHGSIGEAIDADQARLCDGRIIDRD